MLQSSRDACVKLKVTQTIIQSINGFRAPILESLTYFSVETFC